MDQVAFALTPSFSPADPVSRNAPTAATPPTATPATSEPPLPPADRASMALVQAILDHVHFGVAVVGPQLQLLLANQAALRECARHPILRVDKRQLVIAQVRQQEKFVHALAAARRGRWSLVRLVHEDARMMLAVMPLWPKPVGDDDPVLVVFGLRSPCEALAIEFFAQSCGLTPTETRLLRGLSEGLSPRDLAGRHDVALSTVRTQLVSIREKTGTCRLTDLLRTLACLPPIMPAALCLV